MTNEVMKLLELLTPISIIIFFMTP